MAKFLSLGSGSSGNCYYLSTATTTILIDAGISVRTLKKHMRDYGLSLEQVDAVFVTHDHADHIKSVGNLANDYDKPVYTTQKVHEGINRNYCVTSKLTAKHIRYVEKNATLEFGDMRITPFEVPHDSTDNVGYIVELDNTVFCLLTDIGHATPEINEAIARAEHLVIEANHDRDMLMTGKYPAFLKGRISSGIGHLSNSETGHLLAENATPILQHVWLCHISQENNHPELARKTVEGVLRDHGIIAGVDFQLEVLCRKRPSEIYELTASET